MEILYKLFRFYCSVLSIPGWRSHPGILTAETTDGAKKARCTLTITGEVKDFSLKETNVLKKIQKDRYAVTLAKGKSLTPGILMDAEYGADKTLCWESEDPSVASVTKKGKITVNRNAASGENARITASTVDGKHRLYLTVTIP